MAVSITADSTRLRSQLALAQADLRALTRELTRTATEARATGDALKLDQVRQLSAQVNAATASVARYRRELSATAGPSREAAAGMAGMIASSGGLVAAVGGLRNIAGVAAGLFAARSVANWSGEMAKAGESAVNLSASLGIPLADIVKLQGVFQLTEGSVEGASRTFRKLSTEVDEAISKTGPARENFLKIGITLDELKAKGDRPVEMLRLLADRFADMQQRGSTVSERAAWIAILGRGIETLVPLLSKGSAGIDELIALFERLNPAALKAAEGGDQVATSLDTLTVAVKGVSNQGFVILKPLIDDSAGSMLEFATQVRQAVAAADSLLGPLGGIVGMMWNLNRMGPFGPLRDLGSAGLDVLGGGDPTGNLRQFGRGLLGPLGWPVTETVASADVSAPLQLTLRPRQREPASKGGGGGGKGGGGKGAADDTEKLAREAQQAAQKAQQDAIARIDAESNLADAAFARKRAQVQGLAELGRISAGAQVDAERLLVDRKWALDLDYYQKKMTAATADAAAQTKLTETALVDYQKYLAEKQKLAFDAAKASKAVFEEWTGPIKSAVSTAVQGVIMGTQTAQQALANLGQSVAASFLSKGADKALDWIGNKLFDFAGDALGLGVDAATGATEAAATTVAMTTMTATTTAAMTTMVSTTAAAMAAMAASVAAGQAVQSGAAIADAIIPFAKGGIVPSAAGGWALPRFRGATPALLHSREMVLPAHISEGIQSAIQGGGFGPGGAGMSFNLHAVAADGPAIERLFKNNGRLITDAVKAGLRSNALTPRTI